MANFNNFTTRVPDSNTRFVGFQNPAGTGAEGKYTFDSVKSAIIASLSLGTAATRDTGTGATQIPLNSDINGYIGTTIQPFSTKLNNINGATYAADRLQYWTGASSVGVTDLTPFARTLLDDADAGTARTTLGAQEQDSILDDLSGISFAQGDLVYYNGSNLAKLAAGTTGQILKTNGVGANPVWTTTTGRETISDISATGTLTANAFDEYTISTTGATISLWAAPINGDVVTIINYSGGSNTISGNGKNIRSGSGTASASVTILNDEVHKYIYQSSSNEWLLTT